MSTGMKTVLVIIAAAAALAITVFAVTERRGFSALFLNAIGGLAALFAVNITDRTCDGHTALRQPLVAGRGGAARSARSDIDADT